MSCSVHDLQLALSTPLGSVWLHRCREPAQHCLARNYFTPVFDAGLRPRDLIYVIAGAERRPLGQADDAPQDALLRVEAVTRNPDCVTVSLLLMSPVVIGLIPAMRVALYFLPQLLVANRLSHRSHKLPYYRITSTTRNLAFLVMSLVVLFGSGLEPGLVALVVVAMVAINATAGGVGGVPFADVTAKVVPHSRLALADAIKRARAVDDRVERLARDRNFVALRPRADWYGIDPIHIRLRHRRSAWREILSHFPGGEAVRVPRATVLQTLYLRTRIPERRRLLGFEQCGSQPSARLRDGTTVAIY